MPRTRFLTGKDFATMTSERYFLGCPVWGMKAWVGSLYRRGSQPRQFLPQYAGVFNTVEGNTTFYYLPRPEIVERWVEDSRQDPP